MTNQNSKSSVISNLKIYLFPSLATILAMMIWRDVTELRSDVKQLLSESASNKAKVERLEKQVDVLNQVIFKMPKPIAGDFPQKHDNEVVTSVYAILNKENEFDIKKS